MVGLQKKRINFVKMNIKNSILLLDPQFDPGTAPDCNLLLKITNDSFSYAIINQENQRLKAIFDEQECSDISQTLVNKLKNDPYLKYPFKKVKISMAATNAVDVPNELYQSADLSAYLNFFNSGHPKNIYIQKNTRYDFTSVFNLQKTLEEQLDANFKDADIYEQTAPVLMLAATLSEALVLDFTARSFTAVYVKEQQLVFKNSYEIENAEEFNYYLLFILKQLGLDASSLQLHVSGILEKEDQNYKTLEKYFMDIRFSVPQNQAMDYAILDDMPPYYYSSLLAVDLCG